MPKNIYIVSTQKEMMERLLKVFKRTENVEYEKVSRSKYIVGYQYNEFTVIQSIVENPHTSQGQISRKIGISTVSNSIKSFMKEIFSKESIFVCGVSTN